MRAWKWEGGQEESEMRHERMEGMNKCLQGKLNERVEEGKLWHEGVRPGEVGDGRNDGTEARDKGMEGKESGNRLDEGGDVVFWRQEVENKPRDESLLIGWWRFTRQQEREREREGTTEECRWDKSIWVCGEHLNGQMRPDYIAVKENETDGQKGRQTRGWMRTKLQTKADFLHI